MPTSTLVKNQDSANFIASSNMREVSYVNALNEAQSICLERDEKVFLFGLDVDDHLGIQGSTIGLPQKFGNHRVFGTPLSEDAMTGVAIGAAMAGYRPIHVHIRMDFMLLCMNQLANIAAKAHYMYEGQVKVPLVVRTLIGRSWGQGAQHSQALHALFMHIPGLKVVAPTTPHDAKGTFISAVEDNNPVIFMEHRLLCNTKGYVNEGYYKVELGVARKFTEGTDVTIVAISHMVIEALRAANCLKAAGISAEVIDPVTLHPLDFDTILKSVQKTKRLLIVDNGWLSCGFTSELMTRMYEAFTNNPLLKENNYIPKMKRMGFAATPCPTTRVLEDLFYPSAITIAKAAYDLVADDKDYKWLPEKIENKELAEFKGPF